MLNWAVNGWTFLSLSVSVAITARDAVDWQLMAKPLADVGYDAMQMATNKDKRIK